MLYRYVIHLRTNSFIKKYSARNIYIDVICLRTTYMYKYKNMIFILIYSSKIEHINIYVSSTIFFSLNYYQDEVEVDKQRMPLPYRLLIKKS